MQNPSEFVREDFFVIHCLLSDYSIFFLLSEIDKSGRNNTFQVLNRGLKCVVHNRPLFNIKRGIFVKRVIIKVVYL